MERDFRALSAVAEGVHRFTKQSCSPAPPPPSPCWDRCISQFFDIASASRALVFLHGARVSDLQQITGKGLFEIQGLGSESNLG